MALSPAEILFARAADPKSRARDFAERLGIAEAQLVAATGAVRIDAHPDRLFPLLETLGDVLALTRNPSCVIEQVGTYLGFRAGAQASMINGPVLDMRMFPADWTHGFAVTEGEKRSIQIFDAAGTAVHKVHLRPESDLAAFEALVAALRLPGQSDELEVTAVAAPEAAKLSPARAEALRADWEEMTDTHQFLKLARRHGMNRLGAYRALGAPQAVPLAPEMVTRTLELAAAREVPVMIFVGNAGCIQIFGGTPRNVRPMGPWINVLDPGFDLHLRQDHVAEVWLVTKPTRRGPAISVEAFDAEGRLIAQIFGRRSDGAPDAWPALTAALERMEMPA